MRPPPTPAREGRGAASVRRTRRTGLAALVLATLLALPWVGVGPALARMGAPLPTIAPAVGGRGAPPGPDLRPPDAGGFSAPPRAAGSPPPNLLLTGTTVLNLSESTTFGNVTIEDSAALIFGNSSWTATLTIEGNVEILGNGSLRLWDSWTNILGSYTGQRNVDLFNDARVVLDEAIVGSGGVTWYASLNQAANLSVQSSSVGSWAVVQINDNATLWANNSIVNADLQPSADASVTDEASAGSHLWFEFRNGTSGTFSFPAPNVETTWSFPPEGALGFSYRYRLVDDWPGLCAAAIYPGANVTVANSSEVDLSFLPEATTLDVAGLRFGPVANFTLASTQFVLRLANVSVESWSFYPVNASFTAIDSQLGEVMGWSGSRMTLEGSNLTDAGGYYATWDDSTMSIVNCSIGSTVLAYDEGTIGLANSTVGPGEEVLAVDNASIDADNVSLGSGGYYAAENAGQITVRDPVVVSVVSQGAPVGGATVSLRNASGTGSALVGTTSSSGRAYLLPEIERIDAMGAHAIGPYDATATSGFDGAETQLALSGPGTWDANLTPLVGSTTPPTGSRNDDPTSNVTVQFGLPMNRTATDGAVSIAPAVGVLFLWTSNATVLTIEPDEEWPSDASVVVAIGPSAETVDGIALPADFLLTFATAAGPEAPPSVVATTPADGSQSVGLDATVVVEFSVAMDPTSTADAFSIAPAASTASVSVTGSLLVWSGAGALAAGTTYTARVAASATSADGTSLAAPVTFSFATIAASEVPVVTSWSPSNGSVVAGAPGSITIGWNVPMDPASTIAAFSITPATPGSTSVIAANLTWTPATELASNVTYTLEIGPTARSASGVPVRGTEWSVFRWAAPVVCPAIDCPGLPHATAPAGVDLWAWLPWGAATATVALAALAVGFWLRGRRPPVATPEGAGRT
jgi:Big-like domain-containing protein